MLPLAGGIGVWKAPSHRKYAGMVRLSIQTRQALAKLTLPVLVAASFGLMLLGKADALLAERARMALGDALAPIYAALARPLGAVRDHLLDATDVWGVHAANLKLREENEQLRQWQSIALALDAENQRLKAFTVSTRHTTTIDHPMTAATSSRRYVGCVSRAKISEGRTPPICDSTPVT